MNINTDNYGEIINGEATYRAIAYSLIKEHKPIIIGWTDQEYDHRDILFILGVNKKGYLQRGLKENDLFVSIVGSGSLFGFIPTTQKEASYILEKLMLQDNTTNRKIAELINGVITYIDYMLRGEF